MVISSNVFTPVNLVRNGRSDALHFVERRASTKSRTYERADAGARNEVDGNAGFAKDAQNANVGDTAGESASEREADARALRWFALFAFGDREQPFFGGLQPADCIGHFAGAHSDNTLTRAMGWGHSSFDQGMAVL
jgi:hypothetical protein